MLFIAEHWLSTFAATSRLRDALDHVGECVLDITDFKILRPESYPTDTFIAFAHACVQEGLPWPNMPAAFVASIVDLAASMGAVVEWPTCVVRRGNCVELIRADEVVFRKIGRAAA